MARFRSALWRNWAPLQGLSPTFCGDGHREDVGDVLAGVGDFKRFGVEAAAAALLAGDVDVREKAHFKLAHAVPAADLATSALHVEGEAPGGVATRARGLGLGEELADLGEEADVGRGIGTRGAADRRLVDLDDLVEVLGAGELGETTRDVLGAVERAAGSVPDE